MKLYFYQDQLLVHKKQDHYFLPALDFAASEFECILPGHAIGIFNASDCVAISVASAPSLPESYQWLPLRAALDMMGMEWFAAISKAYTILRWDNNHRYCGRCGQPTLRSASTSSFERRCEPCALYFYPRISPSIIVLIQKGKQILLARQASFKPGVFALIAGFVEAGENLEEAVHREVKEEVGIAIKNVRYFASQAWPFPDSLMIAFRADYAEGEIALVDGELEQAGWYDVNNLPGFPSSSFSISRHLIDYFVNECYASQS